MLFEKIYSLPLSLKILHSSLSVCKFVTIIQSVSLIQTLVAAQDSVNGIDFGVESAYFSDENNSDMPVEQDVSFQNIRVTSQYSAFTKTSGYTVGGKFGLSVSVAIPGVPLSVGTNLGLNFTRNNETVTSKESKQDELIEESLVRKVTFPAKT